MRSSPWLCSLFFVGLGAVACSSSSSGPGTSPGPEGGPDHDGSPVDGTALDQSAPASCGDLAACYSVAVTVSASSPAACGSGTLTRVADYTDIPSTGGAFTTTTGCTGELSGCTMTLNCPNGEAWTFAFAGQGFTATVSLAVQGGQCDADAVGTRLDACPVATGDDAGPQGGDASVEASWDGASVVDAGDASLDGGSAEASTADATISDGSTQEAGQDSATDGEATEGSAAVDAQADASGDDGGPSTDASDAGSDDASE